MVCEVARAQTALDRIARQAKMNPVMENLVKREAGQRAGASDHPGIEPKRCYPEGPQESQRDPCPNGEDGARLAVMHPVHRADEAWQDVAEPSMDQIFKEGPNEQAADKRRESIQHQWKL